MTDIWRRGGAYIAALRPGPGDMVIVTTLGGKLAALDARHDYEGAIDRALTLAGERRGPTKVIPMTLVEAATFCGITYEKLMADMSEEQWRNYCIGICTPLVSDHDPKVRADATELLTSLGAMPQ